jgi:polysaccharide pyruvyl transferase WcaK-like protein
MQRIHLDEALVCEIQPLNRGRDDRLAKVVSETRHLLESGPVEWVVPVTPRTVYRIGGVFSLAAEQGCSIGFEPTTELDERQQEFFDDFRKCRLPERSRTLASAVDLLSDVASLAKESVAAVMRRIVPERSVPFIESETYERVVLIGAYGGDHIGDTAILGGVLLKLNAKSGTKRATLLSHRPAHTRRLADGIETPVVLSVHEYCPKQVDRLLERADLLVLAGGPLMDLPRVLVKHLYSLLKAQKRGIPLVIESVGIGPFKRRVSRWMARRIVTSAQAISVRTSRAAQDPIVGQLEVEVSRDPAFTYLPTRPTLGLIAPGESDSIAELLSGTERSFRVGINLRPIRHLWSSAGKEFSERAEHEFMQKFAAGLESLITELEQPISYVFFPMNSIQFGQSDLQAAYQLQRMVSPALDLRLWEFDPTVDGMLELLRGLDVAVAMRLHACIFAMSQQLPLLGIDYYPGQGGKVEELFGDLDRAEDVRRMDTFESAWLVDRLMAHFKRKGTS